MPSSCLSCPCSWNLENNSTSSNTKTPMNSTKGERSGAGAKTATQKTRCSRNPRHISTRQTWPKDRRRFPISKKRLKLLLWRGLSAEWAVVLPAGYRITSKRFCRCMKLTSSSGKSVRKWSKTTKIDSKSKKYCWNTTSTWRRCSYTCQAKVYTRI